MLLRDSESGVRGHHQVRACRKHRRLGSSLAEPASSESLDIALRARGWLRQTSSEDGHVHYFKYGGVAEDAREARYQRTHACTYKYVFPVIRAIIAAATIREWRLFRSALAQVRLLFESGVYSRGASIRSYTVNPFRVHKVFINHPSVDG